MEKQGTEVEVAAVCVVVIEIHNLPPFFWNVHEGQRYHGFTV